MKCLVGVNINNMLIQVKFTKIGNKIKYELPFTPYCTVMKKFDSRGMTLDKNDGLFRIWLGTNQEIDKMFKSRTVIYKKVELVQIYDACDTSHMPSLK